MLVVVDMTQVCFVAAGRWAAGMAEGRDEGQGRLLYHHVHHGIRPYPVHRYHFENVLPKEGASLLVEVVSSIEDFRFVDLETEHLGLCQLWTVS